MTIAIEIDKVVKRFGSFTALDDLDVEVETGEVHGYLGPNGAGKSVTIRTLLGLLRHDSGTVQLLGGDPWHDAVQLHRRLAYVPGDVTCGRTCLAARSSTTTARLRGGCRHRQARRTHRTIRARPAEEGTDVLEGKPPEGGVDHGARRPTPNC